VTRDRYYWLHLAGLAWPVFLFYWLASAQKLKKVKQREAYGERLVQLAFMTAACTLVFNDIFGHGWLGRRFPPVSGAIGETGFRITVIGVALAIWARSNFLTQEFGETFNDHMRRTGMFLPSLGGHE